MLAIASQPVLLRGFDPTLLLVLNLAGTFVFGLSGGLAAVRAKLDLFGVVVLAMAVGLAGGITRDLLIGVPPATFRDWRYLAVAAGAGLVTFAASATVGRFGRSIIIFDAGGLSLFCVTGAAAALQHRVGPVEAIILGAVTGIGGGILRDILLRQVPVVLREGLYAVPALCGAAVVVAASEAGTHRLVFPIVGRRLLRDPARRRPLGRQRAHGRLERGRRVDDRLLLVALDDLWVAWTRRLGVETRLAQCAALPEQIPALVEGNLQRLEPPSLVLVRPARVLALPELVVLGDELLDPAVNPVVFHLLRSRAA